MRNRLFPLLTMVTVLTAAGVYAQTPSGTASGYLLPPKVVVDIFDAPPTPSVIVGPQREMIALLQRRSAPTIAELARPIYRVAGARIDPATNARQQRTGGIVAITLKTIDGGRETKIQLPADPNVAGVSFSPDGKRIAFTNTTDEGVQLWVADAATGSATRLVPGDRLNATNGDPCDWLADSVTLLCQLVPASRGAAPVAPRVPNGPNIQETAGKAAPAPTYEDLIKTVFDEQVFAYYFTSQLAAIDAASGRKTTIGQPAIFESASASPDGHFILVEKIKRPFSRLVPMRGFPADLEVWNERGETVRTIAAVPSSEGVPINGVITGPRDAEWRPDRPATVIWVEALDKGDLKNDVPHRDKVMALDAPFSGDAAEIAKTAWRFSGLSYTDTGVGLLTESDRATRHVRTWILEANAAPRQLWDRRQQDAYGNPGTPVARPGRDEGGRRGSSDAPIIQVGDSIYLSGQGASPEGDRPFLDRLDLKTLATVRLFRSESKTYETFVAPLDDRATKILTRFETPTDPPNYFVRDIADGTKQAITHFTDPAPQLAGVQKQFVTYERKDGVKLSGTLYLPPGYTKGERLPMLMWAYPREFTDRESASQVTGSPYRFTTLSGASHLYLLTQGYAIFDNPSMPIVGAGETANDTYVDQLVASAQAAVDKVVDMGVADRDRIGIGGHSYGAFMTANLLAHSDLFRAGIARSGAYNRSLTPFGFQSERRTFWEVPEVYARMSPFWYADDINEPILLIHGEADDNSGTYPIQSERLYMALKGFGATVRYVTLPYEAHGYSARESNLHVLAEMINWMDTHVKHAAPRSTTTATSGRQGVKP
ncbi:MAG TPA: prolyl oligopeptidase family serine peptidase [Vicinamibacterales bacterium]|nr:prolyl oligopeptidase family serine peptidase [Vicinamibacterales bacterium]